MFREVYFCSMEANAKMKVEIWSDIMCPFCYIGKRKFESAVSQFAHRDQVEIVWKSFQLDPGIPEDATRTTNVYEYLAQRKGMSYEQSIAMHQHVVEEAQKVGLAYHFDTAVVANSFKAHQLIQLAKSKGLGDEAEERLMRAYFTEGKDMSDPSVLSELGTDIGLTVEAVDEALTDKTYAAEVTADIDEAAQLGARGVPFFVLDRKYAVSGAQQPEVFLGALEKSFAGWREANPTTLQEMGDGPACTPDGDC